MPSRRQFLVCSGSISLSAFTGCQTATDAGESDASSATSSPGTDSASTAGSGSAPGLRFERESYWLHGTKLPPGIVGFPDDEVDTLSDLDGPTKAAVKTALTDGRYATTQPPEALLGSVDDVTFVEYQGTYYSISHTFPTYTIRLDTSVPEATAPSERIAELDSDTVEANEAVQDAIYTVTPHGMHHAGEPYTTTQLPAALRTFLDEYDYVKSSAAFGELVLTQTERPSPYSVTATEATDEQLYGRPVLEFESFSATAQQLIERTLADERTTPLNHDEAAHSIFPDDIPDRFDRRLDRESYFVRVDGTIYGFDARHLHWEDHPFEISTAVTDDTDDESLAHITLAARNTGSRAAQFEMPGITPFGILWAYGPSGEHVLWNPEYRATEDVSVEDGAVAPESHVTTEIGPGQTTETTYHFGRETTHVESGEYTIPGFIWVKWPTEPDQEKYDWRPEIYPYTLTYTVD